MRKMEREKDTNETLVVPPLKKGRRTLLFLANFFIVFILSLVLFHAGIYPLGRLIVDYDGKQASLHLHQENRDSVLYGHQLLYSKKEGETGYDKFETNFEYTSTLFIQYFVFDGDSAGKNPIERYFKEIHSDYPAYISIMNEINAKTAYFDYNPTSSFPFGLKEQYKEEFFPYYNQGDTMSSKGSSDFAAFQDKVFAQAYRKMLADIMDVDLTFNEQSYRDNQKQVDAIISIQSNLVVGGAIVSYLIVWIIFMLLIPTFSKRHRDIAMIVLRVERFKREKMEEPSSLSSYLQGLYFLLGGMAAILFVPWGSVPFNELFALPILFPLSLISLAYLLGSTAFMLFDSLNRTLGDFFTGLVLVSGDDLDDYASVKGGSGWLSGKKK